MPGIESWGHVGIIIYRYPKLCGTSGRRTSISFGIDEKTYALHEKMYDEVVRGLDDKAAVHVGLDEANWSVLPGEDSKNQTPVEMVRRIHEILIRVANRYHKKITMYVWADHGG